MGLEAGVVVEEAQQHDGALVTGEAVPEFGDVLTMRPVASKGGCLRVAVPAGRAICRFCSGVLTSM